MRVHYIIHVTYKKLKGSHFPQVTAAVVTQRRLLARVTKSTRIQMCEDGDVTASV